MCVTHRSDSDSDNESGDPEKKKLQDKLSGIVVVVNYYQSIGRLVN